MCVCVCVYDATLNGRDFCLIRNYYSLMADTFSSCISGELGIESRCLLAKINFYPDDLRSDMK